MSVAMGKEPFYEVLEVNTQEHLSRLFFELAQVKKRLKRLEVEFARKSG